MRRDGMLRLLTIAQLATTAIAGHCYGNTQCTQCVNDARGSPCAWCGGCQMAWDSCSGTQVTAASQCTAAPPPPPLPGDGPFFEDVSSLLSYNPTKRNYGVAVTDTNADGTFEFVVAGYGSDNLIYQWNGATSTYQEIAPSTLKDPTGRAIGVAACDIDGDGYEEVSLPFGASLPVSVPLSLSHLVLGPPSH